MNFANYSTLQFHIFLCICSFQLSRELVYDILYLCFGYALSMIGGRLRLVNLTGYLV